MSARKLEVNAKIFSINSNVLNNIRKSVSDVWIEVLDVYPNLLSSPEWVLTRRQKELWVVCIDIWASTTGVTIYEEWVLRHSAVIPLGWDNITNDIALWLRTSTLVAEKLKLEQSTISTSEKEVSERKFDLSKLNIWEQWEICLKYLSQITTARYEEIFHYIREELKSIWKDWMLPEWAVFVWWAVKTKQFLDSAKESLKLPCFIWTPEINDDMSDSFIQDPVYSAIIWTLVLANKYSIDDSWVSFNLWGIFWSIMKVFKKLLP
jgi:cell division protein FtsA